jgi:hypothetical protein
MKKSKLINIFVDLLLEKGGVQNKSKKEINFYTQGLMLTDDIGTEFEVKQINKEDPNPENWLFKIYRYAADGSGRTEEFVHTADEILSDFKHT